jgi:hypothetical protein
MEITQYIKQVVLLSLLSLFGLFGLGQSSKYKPLSCFDGDSLKYVEYNFVHLKQMYTGRSLEKLFNKMEISVKSFNYEKDNELELIMTNSNARAVTKQFWLFIMLRKGPRTNNTALLGILRQSHGLTWYPEIKNYFASFIVSDIMLKQTAQLTVH